MTRTPCSSGTTSTPSARTSPTPATWATRLPSSTTMRRTRAPPDCRHTTAAVLADPARDPGEVGVAARGDRDREVWLDHADRVQARRAGEQRPGTTARALDRAGAGEVAERDVAELDLAGDVGVDATDRDGDAGRLRRRGREIIGAGVDPHGGADGRTDRQHRGDRQPRHWRDTSFNVSPPLARAGHRRRKAAAVRGARRGRAES